MTDAPFPSKLAKYEIQTFEKPKDFKTLKKTHVPFSGSPHRHPHDEDKIILIADPFSGNTAYYEFKIKDVDYYEELPNIVDVRGKALTMVRLWLKKFSIGVRCAPFLVEDIESMNSG